MIPVEAMKEMLVMEPVNVKIFENQYWLEYPDLIFIVYPERIHILEFTAHKGTSVVQKDIVKIMDIQYLNVLLEEYYGNNTHGRLYYPPTFQ